LRALVEFISTYGEMKECTTAEMAQSADPRMKGAADRTIPAASGRKFTEARESLPVRDQFLARRLGRMLRTFLNRRAHLGFGPDRDGAGETLLSAGMTGFGSDHEL
jgi:hypothetical protein